MNEIHALSGAYAVDAVDDVERARFEKHLAECADCRAEVRSLREAGAMVGSADAATPPPALRSRVLDQIATVRPLPPVTAGTISAPVRGVRRARRFPTLVAAAVTAGLVGVGGVAVYEAARDGSSTTQTTLADRVLQAKDAVRHDVPVAAGGSVTLVNSASLGRAVVVTKGLAKAPSGHTYELWLRKDGAMIPAGLMSTNADQTVVLEGDSSGATGAGITVEPTTGSEVPTSDPIAMVDFQRKA